MNSVNPSYFAVKNGTRVLIHQIPPSKTPTRTPDDLLGPYACEKSEEHRFQPKNTMSYYLSLGVEIRGRGFVSSLYLACRSSQAHKRSNSQDAVAGAHLEWS